MRTTILLCAIALVLSACDDAHQTAASASQAAPANPTSDAPAVAVESPSTPQPTHNYAMEQDGEYGYQPGISQDESNSGVATKPLVMIRYRGEKNGVYTLEIHGDNGYVQRAQCANPCKFIKATYLFQGQPMKTETVPNTPGALANDMFEDAINGQLKPYGK